MGFHDNVFVNCPFDEEYLPLLRPLLFTIFRLGLRPRIALEELDSGAPRVQKIIRLIALVSLRDPRSIEVAGERSGRVLQTEHVVRVGG
jgi:hypothetical protein